MGREGKGGEEKGTREGWGGEGSRKRGEERGEEEREGGKGRRGQSKQAI